MQQLINEYKELAERLRNVSLERGFSDEQYSSKLSQLCGSFTIRATEFNVDEDEAFEIFYDEIAQ